MCDNGYTLILGSVSGTRNSWRTPGKPSFSFHQFPEDVPRAQFLPVLMGTKDAGVVPRKTFMDDNTVNLQSKLAV